MDKPGNVSALWRPCPSKATQKYFRENLCRFWKSCRPRLPPLKPMWEIRACLTLATTKENQDFIASYVNRITFQLSKRKNKKKQMIK